MTDTIARGAANQAGARINKDAYAEAQDFLPLKGIDHVEFWVGNARQASAYYRALWGFTPVAFAGLETGVRDRASYVMRQNDITFVFTAPLTPDGEIAEHVQRHGDGVKDIAFAVDDVTSAFAETTKRGAKPAIEPTELDGGEDGVLRRSAVSTYGETRHSFIDRNDYHGVFAPGYRKIKKPARAAEGLSLLEVDHCVGNVGARPDERVRRLLPRRLRLQPADPLRRQGHPHRIQRADVKGHDQRQRPDQVPDQRARDGQEEEPDPGVPRLVPGCPAASTSRSGPRTSSRPSGSSARTASSSWACRTSTTRTLADRVGDVGVPIETLEELGIEADRDEEGYLLQIFTRPVQDRPTFFFEIIERHGSRGFGVGNFKALFEAIEREQAKRGNLWGWATAPRCGSPTRSAMNVTRRESGPCSRCPVGASGSSTAHC